jgi:beta-lactamase superfamily II metal-dependent hydrolase
MYHGLEVDMLSVGDADCILVTNWASGVADRVLIDGGNKGDFDAVRAFLAARDITYLDAVVSTHLHDDHAAGLLQLVKDKTVGIGTAYVHVPHNHVDTYKLSRALRLAAGSDEAECFQKTMATAEELALALIERGIPFVEPFEGTQIRFMVVTGPSVAYYEELLAEFTDAEKIKNMDLQKGFRKVWSALHDNASESLDTELLENPQTSPENNASVILAFAYTYGGKNYKYLLTSDAGVPALQRASQAYLLGDCYWVQIPHHGSRHNINPALIKLFGATQAWVSAIGNIDHPRHAVVNAFKKSGARVLSTHYPHSGHLWHHKGNVPTRQGYDSAVPLYEAKLSKAAAASALSNSFFDSLLNAK